MPNPTIDSPLIWNSFKKGDIEAYKMLYQQHVGYLLNYGLRLYNSMTIVEDSVQEVFIDLWQYRQNLNEPSEVRFYLMKCLRNKISKQFKVNQPFVSGFDGEVQLPFLVEPSSEHRLIELQMDAEISQKVQHLMNELSPREREIVYLKYFNDMSYEQICELMNINYQTARSQHYNALKRLRYNLKQIQVPLMAMLMYCLT
jgi:RNA polymerase sigma factor (sigma-70 family)